MVPINSLNRATMSHWLFFFFTGIRLMMTFSLYYLRAYNFIFYFTLWWRFLSSFFFFSWYYFAIHYLEISSFSRWSLMQDSVCFDLGVSLAMLSTTKPSSCIGYKRNSSMIRTIVDEIPKNKKVKHRVQEIGWLSLLLFTLDKYCG